MSIRVRIIDWLLLLLVILLEVWLLVVWGEVVGRRREIRAVIIIGRRTIGLETVLYWAIVIVQGLDG